MSGEEQSDPAAREGSISRSRLRRAIVPVRFVPVRRLPDTDENHVTFLPSQDGFTMFTFRYIE